jgi:hypothetical protein
LYQFYTAVAFAAGVGGIGEGRYERSHAVGLDSLRVDAVVQAQRVDDGLRPVGR